ncbi:MAG: class I SAM-dependent methyltransferase [Anaerolineales bacterium]|nr:class I SAM-dependent methyltransferase [Anaerolineales bacterium]
MKDKLEKDVIKANIAYHTALADSYDKDQPHFMSENVARVDAILAELARKTGGGSLLDLGCGTGFIVDIAKKYFDRIVGVDITPAMLSHVEVEKGKIEVYEADTSDLSFLEEESFDVCTAYSFLHHLLDFEPTLHQAYRCLKPGGKFYADQDPNCHYWQLITGIEMQDSLADILKREIRYVVDSLEEAVAETGLTIEEAALAEYHDVSKGGIDGEEMVGLLKNIGFGSATCRYEWFLGQGYVIHQHSPEMAAAMEAYLREILPASRHLFKYQALFAEK